MEGRCVLSLVGKDSGTSGGVGAFPIPFIKYFQYFLSRARCSHNFNDPYRSTVGTMSAMFCNRVYCWRKVHIQLAVVACLYDKYCIYTTRCYS